MIIKKIATAHMRLAMTESEFFKGLRTLWRRMKLLGKKIREERKRLKISQSVLARETGISRTSLSQLENGAISDIGIRKVMRILEYLGLDLAVRPAGAPPTLNELRKEREAERDKS